ncbi:MAG: glutamyl-tRNA reductase [Deltaproteobacteria bacterium]|jgi:glutamyl-tRNA reductase|nr:glutamyl-tRNA reductase [Deltaproteobacteria bacterium]
MEIFVYGAGHGRTPVAVRERLALVDLGGSRLYGFFAANILSEALILSTCNRLEIVGVAPDSQKAKAALLADIAEQSGSPAAELDKLFHFYQDSEAARYLFRVTAGLDSQVLGEPQILGQVKESFRQALKNRSVGPVVGKLFHKSFRAAKRARSETDLALGAVSVAAVAVEIAEELRGTLAGQSVLILGAGEMAGLAAAHLEGRALKELVIVNRTAATAALLATKWRARSRPWSELGAAIQECDVVFSAVGGAEPILTKEFLAPLVNRPLGLFDLGVPRNIEASSEELPGVMVRNIDQIADLVKAHQLARQNEVNRVEAIIDEELGKFNQWLAGLAARPTIKDLTRLAEQARLMELEKTLSRHSFNEEQSQAVEAMGRALIRRVLHNPLSFAKSCHRHGRADHNLDMVRRIFGLDP